MFSIDGKDVTVEFFPPYKSHFANMQLLNSRHYFMDYFSLEGNELVSCKIKIKRSKHCGKIIGITHPVLIQVYNIFCSMYYI